MTSSTTEKIIVFGTGMSAVSFIRSFPYLDYFFFLDNDKQKQYTFYNTLPVLPPEVLQSLDYCVFKVVVASEFYDEISKQLGLYGLKENVNYYSDLSYYLKYSDYFIISFMKCGRTWLRYMIGQLLQRQFNVLSDDILSFTDGVMFEQAKIPIIKAYHDDNPHLKEVNELEKSKAKYKGKKLIFLVRDPRDVAVSLYYHMRFRTQSASDDIDTFVKHKIPIIVNYFNIWFDNKEILKDILIVRYEDMHSKGTYVLKCISAFLDLGDISNTTLEEVLLESSFDKMKSYEQNNSSGNPQLSLDSKASSNSSKVRKGKIGGFYDDLNLDTIREINVFIKQTLNPKFGYGS